MGRSADHRSSKKTVQLDVRLREFVGYTLRRTSSIIQADLAQTLKPFDLRMLTFSALSLIINNPGLRQSQLADAMDVEHPNMVSLIDDLEARNLITRERSTSDRRAYAVCGTEAGKRLYEAAHKAVADHENRLLAGLNDDQRQQILGAMEMIQTAYKI